MISSHQRTCVGNPTLCNGKLQICGKVGRPAVLPHQNNFICYASTNEFLVSLPSQLSQFLLQSESSSQFSFPLLLYRENGVSGHFPRLRLPVARPLVRLRSPGIQTQDVDRRRRGYRDIVLRSLRERRSHDHRCKICLPSSEVPVPFNQKLDGN